MILRSEYQPNLVTLRYLIWVTKEELAILLAEVHSLYKSNISSIPLVIPPVVQPEPLHGPRFFDLFVEDEETIPIVGTKRGR